MTPSNILRPRSSRALLGVTFCVTFSAMLAACAGSGADATSDEQAAVVTD